MDYGNYLTRLMENCRRIVQSSYHQPSSSTMPSTLSTAHLFQEPQVIAPLPAAPRPVAPKDMLPTDISSRPYAFNSLAPPAATTTEPCASSINLSPTATSLDSMTEKARESERRDEIAVPEKPVGSRPFRACSHCRLAKVSRLPSLSSELADLWHSVVVTIIQKIFGPLSSSLSLRGSRRIKTTSSKTLRAFGLGFQERLLKELNRSRNQES